jgi:hypothetical protein
MRKIMLLTPIAASAALVLLTAGPAFAQPGPGETETTFALTGGSLAISVPVGPVELDSAAVSADAQTMTGSLGDVMVTDNRGNVAGWVASALSSAFTGATPVPASAVSYAPNALTGKTGISTVTPTPAGNLSAISPVETATLVQGANTASWNPALSVAVPAGAQTGEYTATLTHSIV